LVDDAIAGRRIPEDECITMAVPELTVKRFTAAKPLYLQIADELFKQIETGTLSPGDRLPSERVLSQMLDVNRMTLRKALELLEEKDLLVRQPGHGTYIAAPVIERKATHLVPFTRGMQERGYAPGARLILLELRPVETLTAQELGLKVSAPVYHIHRLRTINREPVMLEKLTIPAERFRKFEKHDLCSRSIYDVFEAEYGVKVTRARQSLEAAAADDYEAELLCVKPGFPLMLERRLGYDQDDRPVESGIDLFRGDRFRFVTEIAPLDL
jgi:GntR family transcriptional regulator